MTVPVVKGSISQSVTYSGTIPMIYKSRKTILDLLKNQGYDVNDYSDFGVNEIQAMYNAKQLDMLVSANNGQIKERKVYVKYHLGKTLRIEYINEYVDDLFNIENVLKKTDTLVIIINQEVNQTLTNILNQIWEREGIFIILFSLERLQFNILNHIYVPTHIILNEKETEEVIKKYNIVDMKQLPDISRFDPVAQAIGMRPGQICRIERPSKTAVISNYYRYCK